MDDEFKTRKNGGNITSYFCDDQQRVLELVIGPVSAERLQTSAKFARAQYQSLQNKSNQQQIETVKHYWNERIPASAIKEFERYTEHYGNDPASSPKSIAAVVMGAYFAGVKSLGASSSDRNRAQQLLMWVKDQQITWPSTDSYAEIFEFFRFKQLINSLPRLADENSTALYAENLVLMKLPLVSLSKIEKQVFEILVGETYRVRSSEYQEKYDQFTSLLDQQKCVLAFLYDSSNSADRESSVKLNSELNKSIAFRKQFDKFGIITVSNNELFGILSDANLAPFDEKQKVYKAKRNGVGMILFDRHGEARKLLPRKYNRNALILAMKSVAKR